MSRLGVRNRNTLTTAKWSASSFITQKFEKKSSELLYIFGWNQSSDSRMWLCSSVFRTSGCVFCPQISQHHVHPPEFFHHLLWTFFILEGFKVQPLVQMMLEHSQIRESELWFHPKIYSDSEFSSHSVLTCFYELNDLEPTRMISPKAKLAEWGRLICFNKIQMSRVNLKVINSLSKCQLLAREKHWQHCTSWGGHQSIATRIHQENLKLHQRPS
jgi:hypothetical protein